MGSLACCLLLESSLDLRSVDRSWLLFLSLIFWTENICSSSEFLFIPADLVRLSVGLTPGLTVGPSKYRKLSKSGEGKRPELAGIDEFSRRAFSSASVTISVSK